MNNNHNNTNDNDNVKQTKKRDSIIINATEKRTLAVIVIRIKENKG